MGKRFQTWLAKAHGGDRDAMMDVGVAYRYGRGVERDPKRARLWYERAAALDEPNAHGNLSLMYRYGEGARKNPRRSFVHAKRSAELGNVRRAIDVACAHLDGWGTRRNRKLGLAQLEVLEERGIWRARRTLALRWIAGDGLRKDVKRGLALLQKGAGRGDEESWRALGDYFHDLRGTSGCADAIIHYRHAARLGSVRAMVNLHDCFEEGHPGVVEKDERKAVAWLRRAVKAHYDESGHDDSWAWYLLAERMIRGRGVRLDVRGGLRLLWRAARDEQGGAWLLLAELAFEGHGMKRDLRKARFWLRKAKEREQDTRALERRMSAAGSRRGARKS